MLLRAATIVAPPLQGSDFGGSLAAGDFNADGRDDLAVGVEGLHLQTGEIIELFGSAGGLTAVGARYYDEDSPGVPGTNGAGDRFGVTLAAADFDGDGHADLAIGAALESLGAARFAGAVIVLYGRSTGLTSGGAQEWTRNSPGVGDVAESTDLFGESLRAEAIRGGTRDSLVIGVPFEDSSGLTDNGAVEILPGGSGGLTSTNAQSFDAHVLTGGAASGAQLGYAPAS